MAAKHAIVRTADNPWGFYDRELTKHTRDWKQVLRLRPARRRRHRAAVAARAAGVRAGRDAVSTPSATRSHCGCCAPSGNEPRHAAGLAGRVLSAGPHELRAAELLPEMPRARSAHGSLDGDGRASRRQSPHRCRCDYVVAAGRAAGSRGFSRRQVAPRGAASRTRSSSTSATSCKCGRTTATRPRCIACCAAPTRSASARRSSSIPPTRRVRAIAVDVDAAHPPRYRRSVGRIPRAPRRRRLRRRGEYVQIGHYAL